MEGEEMRKEDIEELHKRVDSVNAYLEALGRALKIDWEAEKHNIMQAYTDILYANSLVEEFLREAALKEKDRTKSLPVCLVCQGALKPGTPTEKCSWCREIYHQSCANRMVECIKCKKVI